MEKKSYLVLFDTWIAGSPFVAGAIVELTDEGAAPGLKMGNIEEYEGPPLTEEGHQGTTSAAIMASGAVKGETVARSGSAIRAETDGDADPTKTAKGKSGKAAANKDAATTKNRTRKSAKKAAEAAAAGGAAAGEHGEGAKAKAADAGDGK